MKRRTTDVIAERSRSVGFLREHIVPFADEPLIFATNLHPGDAIGEFHVARLTCVDVATGQCQRA